ncbi:M24 family metallopeptidase [Chloroflexota bacterium]
MPEFGTMGVDWEERISFDRLRRERLQRAKDALDKSDLNALFVFRLEDVRYLTSFRSHLGPVAILGLAAAVLPRGGDPILCTLDWFYAQAHMPWLKKENILPRPFIRTEGGTKKWGEEITAKLGNLVEGKIGVDLWTPSLARSLQKAFPKAEFLDGKAVLAQAQMIKTQDELECQRAATMITEAGFQALLDNLKPGVKECELLALAWQKFTELGSEWSQCSNIVCSGPYTAPYRRFTSDRIIREGDLVIVDIGAGFNGYWGDFTRTYVCGNIMPTKEQIELHQEDYNTLFAALNDARVGNTNADIAKHLNDPVENSHSGGVSGGHGAGVGPWEPPWVSDITPDALIPLEAGMYFSIEPYAGIPGIGGIRLENQVLVTDGEPEIFTPLSFDERLLKDIHPLDKTTGRVLKRRHLG